MMKVGNIQVDANLSYPGPVVYSMLNSILNYGIRVGRGQMSTDTANIRKKAYDEGYQCGYGEAHREQASVLDALDTLKEYFNKEAD